MCKLNLASKTLSGCQEASVNIYGGTSVKCVKVRMSARKCMHAHVCVQLCSTQHTQHWQGGAL